VLIHISRAFNVVPPEHAAGALGSLAVAGVFDFATATGGGTAITAGANVYWDDTNNVATTTATGNKLIGKCVTAAADAEPAGLLRAFYRPAPVSLSAGPPLRYTGA